MQRGEGGTHLWADVVVADFISGFSRRAVKRRGGHPFEEGDQPLFAYRHSWLPLDFQKKHSSLPRRG